MRLSIDTARELLDFGARLRQSGDRSEPPQASQQLRGAVAVHNLLASEGVAYLADEVGMGKTYVAMGAIALFRHFQPGFRVAVIAPRENIQQKWMKEWFTFATHLFKVPDLRVKGLDGGPARPMVACDNLRQFVRETSLAPDRDFFLRMSSFSLATGDEVSSWRELKDRFRQEMPWLDDDLLSLKSKREFKDNLAKAICCVIPTFDLLVVDEAHSLKHGFSERIAARNRVLAFVFGTRSEDVDSSHFPGYGVRAKRVLLLSATPIEDDYRQLLNQLEVLGKSDRFSRLVDESATEEQKKDTARRFLIRRVTTLEIADGRLTKNLYRREWCQGGLDQHDDPIRIEDPRRRLGVALVQKKVAELINTTHFNSTFQMGMLASFESFLETAKRKKIDGTAKQKKIDDGATFDDDDQTDNAAERQGIDVQSVNHLAQDYRRRFGEELPHPKMDALVDRLSSAWRTGRKALVFARRVASVWELKERLDSAYNVWILERLRNAFCDHPRLLKELDTVFAEYQAERVDRRALILHRSGAARPDADTDVDRGGLDTFFAWFFRGDGPKGWISGADFSKQFTSSHYAVSTVLEDNYVAALLGVHPSAARVELARAIGVGQVESDNRLSEGTGRFLTEAKRPGRGELFEAVQAAGVEMLLESHKDGVAERAREVWLQRFLFRKQKRANPLEHSVARYLELRTLFSDLRDERWSELRAAVWPEPEGTDIGRAFLEQELRRELLGVAARLGHSVIDLYAIAMIDRGTLKGGRKDEESTSSEEVGPIERLLEHLDRQRCTPIADRGWAAFDELSNLSAHFDLVLDVNEPRARTTPLAEVGRLFGSLFREQQPVAGMTGQVNKTGIRQFRLPGYPLVLLSTDLLQEGEDLHTFCADIYHYGLAWTPSAVEQRIGRIDRIRSLTERTVQGCSGPLDSADKLQVFYPHLEDTVERLQVRRVLRRMREFIRLMHEGLGVAIADGSRLNVGKEIFDFTTDLPVLDKVLETAFPISDSHLKADRMPLAVSHREAKQMEERFRSLAGARLEGMRVEWEPAREPEVLFGTAHLTNGRRQPFALYVQSLNERFVIRCISPVGSVDIGQRLDFVTDLVTRVKTQVGAIEDATGRGYDLTVEEEVLLGEPECDRARVEWLVTRVVADADLLERTTWPELDAELSEFKTDLAQEGLVLIGQD
jgi:hypothetical protein